MAAGNVRNCDGVQQVLRGLIRGTSSKAESSEEI
jgi:hypothetical protein